MNASIVESSRSDASGGLGLQLVSVVTGLALALSVALMTGAWKGEATKQTPARRIPAAAASRTYVNPATTPELPSSTIYVLRSDLDAMALNNSINEYARSAEMYNVPLMDYIVLIARTADDDIDIDRVIYERSLEYSENGMVLHIVDMRKPRE